MHLHFMLYVNQTKTKMVHSVAFVAHLWAGFSPWLDLLQRWPSTEGVFFPPHSVSKWNCSCFNNSKFFPNQDLYTLSVFVTYAIKDINKSVIHQNVWNTIPVTCILEVQCFGKCITHLFLLIPYPLIYLSVNTYIQYIHTQTQTLIP